MNIYDHLLSLLAELRSDTDDAAKQDAYARLSAYLTAPIPYATEFYRSEGRLPSQRRSREALR